MKMALILTGGTLNYAFAKEYLRTREFSVIIAVDGGLKAAMELGLKPQAVVGDMDTVEEKVLAAFSKDPSITWEIHKPQKNETDTELAIHTAVQYGADSITILGALGGRMDHALSNIQLLFLCLEHKIPAQILDEKNRIRLIKESTVFERSALWGPYLSFLPFTERVLGITLIGFRYPLTNKDIILGREPGLCISNELQEEKGRIIWDEGILICIESRD